MLGKASSSKNLASNKIMAVLSKFAHDGTGYYVEGVINGRVGCGPTRSSHVYMRNSSEIPRVKFRVATLNVGTLRGRSGEVVETLSRRGVDVCCIQEVRWRGASDRMIAGKDSREKLF